MDAAQVLGRLEACGTEQARKTYRRHGVDGDVFGVSYADLNKFKKALKADQPLAESLWRSGNHDARVLATMIADPDTIADRTLEAWIGDATNYVLADAVAGLAARTPGALAVMGRWTASDREWTCGAGWSILSHLAANRGTLPDRELLEGRLNEIEAEIHGAKNRVRHAMNGALIAIALVDDGLCKRATAAAKRIGKVQVDHGDTGCKTPDAIAYIEKCLARKRAAEARASA